MKQQVSQSTKGEKLSLEVILTVGDERYTIARDLNSIEEPLTEKRFEECYRFFGPSVARVLCDKNKIINPGVWD